MVDWSLEFIGCPEAQLISEDVEVIEVVDQDIDVEVNQFFTDESYSQDSMCSHSFELLLENEHITLKNQTLTISSSIKDQIEF